MLGSNNVGPNPAPFFPPLASNCTDFNRSRPGPIKGLEEQVFIAKKGHFASN